jgi:hypothetical protein
MRIETQKWQILKYPSADGWISIIDTCIQCIVYMFCCMTTKRNEILIRDSKQAVKHYDK